MTWFYYVRPDGTAYWSPSAPCFVKDKCLASIDRNERPPESVFAAQEEKRK